MSDKTSHSNCDTEFGTVSAERMFQDGVKQDDLSDSDLSFKNHAKAMLHRDEPKKCVSKSQPKLKKSDPVDESGSSSDSDLSMMIQTCANTYRKGKPRSQGYYSDCSMESDKISRSPVPQVDADENETKTTTWKLNEETSEYYLPDFGSDKLNIPSILFDKLYAYQVVGVQFLASLYMSGIGGILGDDMGMVSTM